ncbi:MAG: hypothetical protein P4L71_20560 [Acetobacteraceae bacterium]|nr:hypothetical protein [Acetobacteraceae bacterium]
MAADSQHAPQDALLSFLEDMSNTMVIVHRLIDDGRTVDLTGLDAQIGLLCAKALDLPAEQGRFVRPALISLLRKVDSVSTALAAHGPAP